MKYREILLSVIHEIQEILVLSYQLFMKYREIYSVISYQLFMKYRKILVISYQLFMKYREILVIS